VVQSTADDFFKTFNNYINSIENPESIINKTIVSNKEVSKYTSIPYWVWVSSLIAIIVIIVAFFA
jgi:hypothetical protein